MNSSQSSDISWFLNYSPRGPRASITNDLPLKIAKTPPYSVCLSRYLHRPFIVSGDSFSTFSAFPDFGHLAKIIPVMVLLSRRFLIGGIYGVMFIKKTIGAWGHSLKGTRQKWLWFVEVKAVLSFYPRDWGIRIKLVVLGFGNSVWIGDLKKFS